MAGPSRVLSMLDMKALSARKTPRSVKRKGSPSRVQSVPFGGSIASRVAGKRSAGGGTDLREAKKKARAGDVIDLTGKTLALVGEAESLRDVGPDQLFGSMSLREAISAATDTTLRVRGFFPCNTLLLGCSLSDFGVFWCRPISETVRWPPFLMLAKSRARRKSMA